MKNDINIGKYVKTDEGRLFKLFFIHVQLYFTVIAFQPYIDFIAILI